jgi:hypothetical protein
VGFVANVDWFLVDFYCCCCGYWDGYKKMSWRDWFSVRQEEVALEDVIKLVSDTIKKLINATQGGFDLLVKVYERTKQLEERVEKLEAHNKRHWSNIPETREHYLSRDDQNDV